MGLYNFKERFVEKIRAGTKRQTIRAVRRHADRAGSTLYLYVGLRTKEARAIGRWVCTSVSSIRITGEGEVFVDENRLGEDEREALAREDGFESFAEMLAFWREPINRLPFAGHLIRWGE